MRTISASKIFGLIFVSIITAWLVAGCTSPTSDWNNRIGKYTLTQAKSDWGKPLKMETTTDGGTSGEWLAHLGGTMPANGGIDTGPRAGGVDQPNGAFEVPNRSEYLHLTFDANGKLTKWERIYR
jgi:hypothetical protein